MSEENVEIVRRMYDAYQRGDNETALAAFHPEVEFDASIRPEGGIYQGPAGIAEAMRTWAGTWDDFRIDVEEIIDAGDRILAAERQTGRGKGSGLPLDQHTYSIFSIRDGKIVHLLWLDSRERAWSAAGLSD
jgi:ketosteroid isomerase-like protein